MKKILSIVTIACFLSLATGCASSTGFSTGKLSAGAHSRAHGWEKPGFTADLKSNPVKSELGLGFVTIGSQAGWGDHPQGKWVSFSTDLGPDTVPAPAPAPPASAPK